MHNRRVRVLSIICLLVVGLTGPPIQSAATPIPDQGELTELWVQGSDQNLALNHHTPDTTYFRGESYVAVPINSRHGNVCTLMLLDREGNIRWRHSLRPDLCNIHSFSDPLIADDDARRSDDISELDGDPELYQ